MVGNWRLFRPDRLWAKVVCVVVAVALAVVWVVEVAIIGFDVPLFSTGLSLLGFADDVGMTLGFLWAAIETRRHHLIFEKRARIGLAAPFLGYRYHLWFDACCILLLYWVMLWARYVVAIPGWVLDVSLPLMLLASIVLIWVTFFPPRSLRRRFDTESVA